MDLQTTHLGGAAILRVAGQVGDDPAGLLGATIRTLLGGGLAVVVVDLHDLGELGEPAVATLRRLGADARERRTALRIIADNPAVLTPLLESGSVDLDIWDTSGRTTMVGATAATPST